MREAAVLGGDSGGVAVTQTGAGTRQTALGASAPDTKGIVLTSSGMYIERRVLGAQGEATTFVCDHLQDWLGQMASNVEVVVLNAGDVVVTTASYNELVKVRTTLPVSFNILSSTLYI